MTAQAPANPRVNGRFGGGRFGGQPTPRTILQPVAHAEVVPAPTPTPLLVAADDPQPAAQGDNTFAVSVLLTRHEAQAYVTSHSLHVMEASSAEEALGHATLRAMTLKPGFVIAGMLWHCVTGPLAGTQGEI